MKAVDGAVLVAQHLALEKAEIFWLCHQQMEILEEQLDSFRDKESVEVASAKAAARSNGKLARFQKDFCLKSVTYSCSQKLFNGSALEACCGKDQG